MSFQLEMSADLGSKFNSRKKFVEALEDLVPLFYENIGQHVQAWVASPPKVEPDKKLAVSPAAVPAIEQAKNAPIMSENGEAPQRPSWATSWHSNPKPSGTSDSPLAPAIDEIAAG